MNFKQGVTENDLRHNLNMIEEKQEAENLRQVVYKAQTGSYYNKRVRGEQCRSVTLCYVPMRPATLNQEGNRALHGKVHTE